MSNVAYGIYIYIHTTIYYIYVYMCIIYIYIYIYISALKLSSDDNLCADGLCLSSIGGGVALRGEGHRLEDQLQE